MGVVQIDIVATQPAQRVLSRRTNVVRGQDPASGRHLGRTCPQLAEDGHGSWYFHVSVTNLMGRRERVRRGGYPTRAAARQAPDETLGRSRQDQTSHTWTLEQWLRYWLTTRVAIPPTTLLSHTYYIERFLIPHLVHHQGWRS